MKRRHVVWLLSLLFIAGVCIRILHFPFRPSAVMRVIPRNAIVVSRHVKPADRLSEMLESGFLDPVLRQCGFLENDPGRVLLEDPGISWLVDTLGKRFVAAGYVENFGTLGLPACIASAWVGGPMTFLARLGFLDDAFPGFQVGRTDGKRKIWRGYFPELPEEFAHLSFGVYEGVAFGVATREPASAHYLMDVMQRQTRSGAERLLQEYGETVPQELPDRVYVDVLSESPFCVGATFDGSSNVLEWQTSIPIAETNVFGDTLPEVLSDIFPLVKPSACVMLGGTAGNAMQVLGQLPLSFDVKLAAELLFTHAAGRRADAAFVAWIPKWDQGGRFMGVRIPSVGMALEVSDELSISDILQPVLRRLNRRVDYAWGYVPYGEQGVHVLVAPSHHWYGKVSSKERMGVALWNGFIFLHSSADALDVFLQRIRKSPAKNPEQMPLNTGNIIFADLPASADVLDKGFASYVLWQITQGKNRDRWIERVVQQISATMREYDLLEVQILDNVSGRGKAVFRLVKDVEQGDL